MCSRVSTTSLFLGRFVQGFGESAHRGDAAAAAATAAGYGVVSDDECVSRDRLRLCHYLFFPLLPVEEVEKLQANEICAADRDTFGRRTDGFWDENGIYSPTESVLLLLRRLLLRDAVEGATDLHRNICGVSLLARLFLLAS